eukprot:scaffold136186_cov42-Prasinocladus_malaysianus.AAC.1
MDPAPFIRSIHTRRGSGLHGLDCGRAGFASRPPRPEDGGSEAGGWRASQIQDERSAGMPLHTNPKPACLPGTSPAFTVMMVVLLGMAYFGFYNKALNLSWMHTNFVPLLTGSITFSFLLSVYLYLSSFGKGKMLAKGGNTKVGFYNFFIGRELNPRIGPIDLKEFFELYPGLIGWVVLDLGMAASQLERIGYVTNSMVL